MSSAQTRSERVDLRMTPSAKRVLMEAARVENKTLTEFLLDRGLQAAFDTLADRRVFVLDDTQWDAFQEKLDQSANTDNPRLDALLARRPPWA